jgi:hypothetical protein
MLTDNECFSVNIGNRIFNDEDLHHKILIDSRIFASYFEPEIINPDFSTVSLNATSSSFNFGGCKLCYTPKQLISTQNSKYLKVLLRSLLYQNYRGQD